MPCEHRRTGSPAGFTGCRERTNAREAATHTVPAVPPERSDIAMLSTQLRVPGTRRSAGARRVLAAAAALLAALTAVATVTTANASVPALPAGWSQVFADDFDGPADTLPSSANWQFDLG